MSILNVNQIQPVGSGQTITISASDITASSATITASSVTANLTGNVTGNVTSTGNSTFDGNVGINTTNPQAWLDVRGDNSKDVFLGGRNLYVNTDSTSYAAVTIKKVTNGFDYLQLRDASNTLKGQITSDGNWKPIAGGGIDFSATSDASGSTSELLDDYEEGTWTPTYESSGASFTYAATTAGTYVKIGRMVFCRGTLRTNSVSGGTASNSVSIGGLPFTVNNSSYGTESGYNSVHVFVGATGTYNGEFPTSGQTLPNTTTAALYYRSTSDGNTNPLLYSDLKTGTNQSFIKFSLQYEV